MRDISYQTGWCYHNQLNGLRHLVAACITGTGEPAGWALIRLKSENKEYTRGGFMPSCRRMPQPISTARNQGPSWQRDGIQALVG